ncbi:MAG: efflux RND transporter permease subunit, partial [Pseudomonadota bacterium]
MNFAALAIAKRPVTYFATLLVFLGGFASFFALGQLEDPDFSIKTAVVSTPYPGASPEEVELEVTDRLEIALQQLPQVDYLESYSSEGLSVIKVNIKTTFWSDKLPQIWDEVRRKVNDVAPYLPPGAGPSNVNDDFGSVFGHQLAVTGDGFSYAQLEEYAKEIKKELSLVEGVARVDLWGVQQKVIYLDVSRTQLSQLGLTAASIEQTLDRQNVVVDSGHVDVGDRRLRFETTGTFRTADDIENLLIRPSAIDALLARQDSSTGQTSTSELIRIGDIGNVRRGYQEPASTLMRFDGEPAIGISITNNQGVNIVDVGKRINDRLNELLRNIPVGINITRVHWQSDIVDDAVSNFLLSFLQALVIVLIVLAIF